MIGKIVILGRENRASQELTRALMLTGYTVILVANESEALACAHQEQPDVILIGLGLEPAFAIDFIRRQRRQLDTPIIMVAAATEVLAGIDALEAGADDFVTQPVRPLELVARLRAILRRTR